ncbi:SCO4225 family membrane protein [Streptomyces flaveolus]|uniref:SCO4225 family membrane protein n=1 Tax=Streptomyces flaveolus TaxID=67297 RepID=UPI0036B51AA1
MGGAVAVAVTQPLPAPDADASFIWVWPALFTFPTLGFAAWRGGVWGGEAPTWFFTGGIAASALVQSLALGSTPETLRGRRRVPTAG